MEDSNDYYSKNMLINNKGLICKEDDCNSDARARGYCKRHYTKNYRLGKFSKSIKDKRNRSKICNIKGCGNIVASRGLCNTHLQRVKKHGDPYTIVAEQHRMSKTGEYSVWLNMKNRCNDPNNKSYKDYGGRGINVCDEWMKSFSQFYKDMGKRPSPKHEIDREDNNKGYEPNNCRWVTRTINARNKTSTKMNTSKVKSLRYDRVCGMSYSELGKKYKISKKNAIDICKNKIWRV